MSPEPPRSDRYLRAIKISATWARSIFPFKREFLRKLAAIPFFNKNAGKIGKMREKKFSSFSQIKGIKSRERDKWKRGKGDKWNSTCRYDAIINQYYT